MRILLATAVAIAPLMAASGAMAEVVISTARTTPITTANATGTGPDSIRLANGGGIVVASGSAVTVNSSNNFEATVGSGITMTESASGSTGLLIEGGNTSNITIAGAIAVTDDIDPAEDLDTDNDGTPDGPFANGTDRAGIRLVGASPLTGNIILTDTASIAVDGNESYGILLGAGLNGKLVSQANITTIGNNSYGIRTTGDVTGTVQVTGTVTVRGENSSAVSIAGNVGGRVTLSGAITSTGYRYTQSPVARPEGYVETTENDASIIFLDELDASDLLQGGPTVQIAGDIGGGIVLDVAPAYVGGIEGDDDGDSVKNGDEDDDGDGVKNRDDTDRDGDGLLDTTEGSSSITSYGTAPALAVGSATRSITVANAGTGAEAYGLINRGAITAQGIYKEVDANAVVIGGNAGQTADIGGGLRNDGTIAALAIDANSTAIRFGEGAVASELLNTGGITAAASSDVEVDVTTIKIDAGATLTTLTNNGALLASAGGGLANLTVIQDLSGTLTTINNTRAIQASLSPNADGDAITGTTTAIDVSANTTGVTVLQTGVAGTATATDPDTDGDGVLDSREPSIVGDIRLGSGADTLDIRNGVVQGAIAFGAGADTLSITGGAQVRGALSDSDGNLAINVANGVLETRQNTTLNATSLDVGAAGQLIVTVDPVNNSSGGINVAGTANLATGAQLGVRFNSLLDAPARFDLITAGTLNAGTLNTDFQASSPYLYVVNGGIDAANNTVYADVRQRTTQEAGLISVEASMYDAFYSSLSRDADMRAAFLAQLGRDDFINLYEQLLPDHSGGPLLSLSSGVDAVTRALTGRNASAAPGETSAWVQEINFYADKEKTDSYGFRSEGFGVAGGVERGSGLGAVGLSVAFTSSDLTDPEAEAEEVLSANLLELGLYWRAQGQYWTTWARAAAGYATFESERRFVGAGLNLSNSSKWNGLTLSAAGGASYERNFGRFSIRPEIYAEYFSLDEDGHTEEGGGDGFDLEIDDRQGHLFSATAAINVGMAMGQNSWLKPELRLGWRQNISVDPGETIARFSSGGPDFALSPDTIEGGGPIVGFRLNVGNELGMLSVSADAEMLDNYVRYMLFLRASFRF